MDYHSDPSGNETTSLLHRRDGSRDDEAASSESQCEIDGLQTSSLSPRHVLPIPFLAALAMSSTAATAYYTYATLLCDDPRHCKGEETTTYAKSIAIAVSMSNILGMAALGPLQSISKTHRKFGLLLWMMVRSMGAVMLLLGVRTRSIYVALSGRIFDGLASDNLLHFTLNSIYTQAQDPAQTSSLIAYSLGLYMTGISTSPFVAGLFQNLTVSFIMAIGLFGLAIVYLQFCVTSRVPRKPVSNDRSQRGGVKAPASGFRQNLITALSAFVAPFRGFTYHPANLLYGLSLFAYNCVQSYTFSALLVYTSLKFGFTGKENGLLITIAHSIAALYIFTSLYIMPRLFKRTLSQESAVEQTSIRRTETKDARLATVSLTLQAASLLLVGFSTKPWQIFLATALLALGLPTPSFIKAHVVGCVDHARKNEILAALAVMEVAGDILGPITFGGLQSHSALDGEVFFVAAAVLGIAMLLFLSGRIVMITSRSDT